MFGFILNLFKHKALAPSAKVAVKSLPTRMVGGINEIPSDSFVLDRGLYKATIWTKRIQHGQVHSVCYNILSESRPAQGSAVRYWNPNKLKSSKDDPLVRFSDCAEGDIITRLPNAIPVRII